jgi:hypothetical protein
MIENTKEENIFNELFIENNITIKGYVYSEIKNFLESLGLDYLKEFEKYRGAFIKVYLPTNEELVYIPTIIVKNWLMNLDFTRIKQAYWKDLMEFQEKLKKSNLKIVYFGNMSIH